MKMLLLIAVAAMAVPFLQGAPAAVKFVDNIPISIKLPDSDELVKTDVPSQSAIPECLKSMEGVTENEHGLVAPAEAFTQCARMELGRLESELKPSAPEPEDSSEEEPVEDDVPPPPKPAAAEPAQPAEPETKKETPPPAESKPHVPEAPQIPDLTSITDAFTKVKPIDKHPTILAEVVKIFQVIFDFRRVMSDMQRILHGDLHGVLREYPDRARGLFHMVSTLPRRFAHARGKVEEVKEESQEPEYMQTLNELHNYLTSAGASSEELPNALSLSSSKVLDEIKDIFTIIPDTFRAYGRRSKLNGGPGIFSPSPVSPLSPWNPLNPLSPISPVSAVARLSPVNPWAPISRAQVKAVDAVSKRLVDLFNARTGSNKSSCLSGICNLKPADSPAAASSYYALRVELPPFWPADPGYSALEGVSLFTSGVGTMHWHEGARAESLHATPAHVTATPPPMDGWKNFIRRASLDPSRAQGHRTAQICVADSVGLESTISFQVHQQCRMHVIKLYFIVAPCLFVAFQATTLLSPLLEQVGIVTATLVLGWWLSLSIKSLRRSKRKPQQS
ncbi:hypothetical protein HPB49_025449 [Dermacentor silvarum]|uniref:Uncharacterized protein n=1 Tax=Dermacentor silvarum TaxID=543639 RepID=A0ACB8C6B9_DERSI|nr:hypothetical protein HPB49_025449 [Dermacentor silvarum]